MYLYSKRCKGSDYMNEEDKKDKPHPVSKLWLIFRNLVEDMFLARETQDGIREKLEEQIDEQQ